MLETVFIGIMAVIVVFTTWRHLRHLDKHDDLLHVCSLCSRIELDGAWEKPEFYIHGTINDDVSTRICPECYQRFYRDLMIDK